MLTSSIWVSMSLLLPCTRKFNSDSADSEAKPKGANPTDSRKNLAGGVFPNGINTSAEEQVEQQSMVTKILDPLQGDSVGFKIKQTANPTEPRTWLVEL